MNLYSIIKELADLKNISIAELERKTGISNGQIGHWADRSPKTENITKVADYFNVSVDYLLGRNATPKWASQNDTIDLKDFLDDNLKLNMAFEGEGLTEEELERLKVAMTQIFWDKRKREK
jgi:transcriptional regulator with XRE-family HTH domain